MKYLYFFQAEADSVVTLQPFRDKCEPVFLFSVVSPIFVMSNALSDYNLQLKSKWHCKITMELF